MKILLKKYGFFYNIVKNSIIYKNLIIKITKVILIQGKIDDNIIFYQKINKKTMILQSICNDIKRKITCRRMIITLKDLKIKILKILHLKCMLNIIVELQEF